MSIDLSVTNKPAVQKKAEEEPDNREQIRDFVQKAAPQKAERASKKHAPVQRKMCSFMIPVPLLEELDRFCEKKAQTRSGIINLAIVKSLDDGLGARSSILLPMNPDRSYECLAGFNIS